VLVGLLVGAALWATGLLIYDLITGEGNANDPAGLLTSGALVCVGKSIVFAVVFWLMDGGGPLGRRHLTVPVDFAFTQQINPEMRLPGWRPLFLDYLHLGFTNPDCVQPHGRDAAEPAGEVRDARPGDGLPGAGSQRLPVGDPDRDRRPTSSARHHQPSSGTSPRPMKKSRRR